MRLHSPQPTFYIMDNPLVHTKSRHGQFIFFKNDDPIGACLQHYGEWAQPEFEFFDLFLKEDSCVIDVGANIGTHSVYFANKCPRGSIISIEPQVFIFNLLATNLTINQCFNAFPIHAAVSGKEGKMQLENINPFVGDKVNYGEFNVNKKANRGMFTNVITLDSLTNLGKFDLIKLDVEGHEVQVLSGAKKIIKEHKPILYIEYNSKFNNDELFDAISSMGYIMYWHLYTKHNPDNFNKASNVWEPPNFVPTEDDFERKYEANAICVHKSKPQPTDLKLIERGSNMVSVLKDMKLI